MEYISLGEHKEYAQFEITEFWLMDDDDALAYAKIMSVHGQDHVKLCDIESRFPRSGHGTSLIRRIEDFIGTQIHVSGFCTALGAEFCRRNDLPQDVTDMARFGDLRSDSYVPRVKPMIFVRDWDEQQTERDL